MLNGWNSSVRMEQRDQQRLNDDLDRLAKAALGLGWRRACIADVAVFVHAGSLSLATGLCDRRVGIAQRRRGGNRNRISATG